MNDIIDRDTAQMKLFAAKLSDFCDSTAHKAATLIRMCDEAKQAMQDQNGTVLAQRLTEKAEELKKQVTVARALAGRIAQSAAILEQSEKED